MSSKRVLILGATGEIGSRIARGCVDEGHRTAGVTRGKNTRHRVSLDGVEILVGDKGDEGFFEAVLVKGDVDVVIDTVPTSEHIKLAHRYFNGNIEHYFICSSTGTYVPLIYLPADENHPWRQKTPVTFFDQSKRDAYALSLWKEDAFPVTVFRPTNIIGPGRVPLELWGGRNILYYRLMREGQVVEMPMVGHTLLQSGCNDDLATAFVKAVAKGNEISGEIFIISSKRAITLDRFFSTAREVLKSTSPVECLPFLEMVKRRPGEIDEEGLLFLMQHMCFDITKAQEILGYSPQYNTEDGLAKALEWCLDQDLL